VTERQANNLVIIDCF